MTISDFTRRSRMKENQRVEPQLVAHLRYLHQRNQRPRSIAERRFAVLRAARVITQPVAEATPDDLVSWQLTLDALSPAGRKNEIVHISQYLKWCFTSGHRTDDPTYALVRPRSLGNHLPRPMDDVDISRAIEAADQPVRAWISLAAFCGLRCMEIASLRAEDVHRTGRPYIRVVGKGDKERMIPVPAVVIAEIDAVTMATKGYVFARMDGKPGPPSAMRVSDRINAHLHALGIAHTAHTLRHRFGTRLYAVTSDPFLVADLMGHASTDTTRGYVRLNPSKGSAPVDLISTLGAA